MSDHRKIGIDNNLFFFNELSPGSCFFEPYGARIYSELENLIKSEYVKRGFDQVITPNIYNYKLWEISGHGEKYKEHMFLFDIEQEKFGLKPMNCPGHCLMFKHRVRSYKELPIRFADFGVLHRNEFSGSLTGLTRVRRFQQDDAHIFCMVSQIDQEIDSALEFIKDIYKIFGFEYELNLSTRPKEFIGEIDIWNQAEKSLEKALNNSGHEWKLNEGDGAFYGPKIDITVKDGIGRKFQCATIQLDFQLPERFKLEFVTDSGFDRPVMIHRAILGSFERMISILTEHYDGKFPFWLSPKQIMIIPLNDSQIDYAKQVLLKCKENNLYAEIDYSNSTLNKKIRNAQINNWNYFFVVGNKEIENNTVSVRKRTNEESENSNCGVWNIDDILSKLVELKKNRNDVF